MIRRLLVPLLSLAGLLCLAAPPLSAQDEGGRIIFKDPNEKEKPPAKEELRPRYHAWGAELMVCEDGFGLGLFYRYEFSQSLSVMAHTSFSESKDSRTFVTYDYYGQEIPLNKINRIFRVPLFFGLHYRLFPEALADNFRPYVGAGAGPVFIYTTPLYDAQGQDMDWFKAFGHGHPYYAAGGYVGAGAYFGFDPRALFGLNFRYYIIPLPKGIPSVFYQGAVVDKPDANTFMITLTIGGAF